MTFHTHLSEVNVHAVHSLLKQETHGDSSDVSGSGNPVTACSGEGLRAAGDWPCLRVTRDALSFLGRTKLLLSVTPEVPTKPF